MKQQATTVRVFGLVARCLFALLLIFTSFYSILAYIPDTYHAFIQAPFMGWIPMLIGFQPFLYALLVTAVSISLWMEKDSDSLSTRLVLEFMIAAALSSICLMIARPYSSLQNDSHSFVLALATIFPILWIGILDCYAYWRKRDWTAATSPRFGLALLFSSALAVAIVYPAAAYLRYWSAGTPLPPIGEVDLLALERGGARSRPLVQHGHWTACCLPFASLWPGEPAIR